MSGEKDIVLMRLRRGAKEYVTIHLPMDMGCAGRIMAMLADEGFDFEARFSEVRGQPQDR